MRSTVLPFAALLVLACPAGAVEAIPLFIEAPAVATDQLAELRGRPSAKRERHLRFAPDGLARLAEGVPGRAFQLALFPDVVVEAVIERVERVGDQGVLVHALALRESQGRARLAFCGEAVRGTIEIAGRGRFSLTMAADGTLVVGEVDPGAFPPCGAKSPPVPALPPGLPPAPPAGAARDLPLAGDALAPLIDVMVVYTAAARAAIPQGAFASKTQAMQAEVALAVTSTNDAYEDSGIVARQRLVHAAEIGYTETGDGVDDLTALTDPSDGIIDQVHTLRNTHRADMVTMWVDDMGGGAGLGWVMTGPWVGNPAFAANAFSVMLWDAAVDNLTFAHELGHNQGCQHDIANAGGDEGAYSYSFGWRFTGNDAVRYRTVMAYSTTPSDPSAPGFNRIGYFSNPAVSYQGVATGTATDDNARTINNTAAFVASFRNAVPTVEVTAPADGAVIGSLSPMTISATADDAESTLAEVEFWVATNGAAAVKVGEDATAPYSISWSGFSQGTHVIEARVTDTVFSASDSVTITVSNPAPVVTITSPTEGATDAAPGEFTLTATATDANGIASVTWLVGGTAIDVDTGAPYTFTWSGLPAGTYAITARAVDTLGASATSAVRTVTVAGPRIVSEAALAVDQGQTLNYQVQVANRDGAATHAYVLESTVTGMALSPTGLLTFTPVDAQVGQHVRAVLRVDATPAGTDRQELLIHVIDLPLVAPDKG